MITERNLLNVKNYTCINLAEASKILPVIEQLQQKLISNHNTMTYLEIKNLSDEVNMWRGELSKHYKRNF